LGELSSHAIVGRPEVVMRRVTLTLALATGIFALPAQSQSTGPTVVAVELSNFRFTPRAIHLRAGVPIVLRLHNASGGGHNFSAPQFFKAARVSPSAANLVGNGTVEILKHSTVEISLVPGRGSYRLKCTHTLHPTFGMRGGIRVD
jgi:plastocyanin